MDDRKHDVLETPDELYNELDKEFNFNYDLACDSNNCKCVNGSMFDRGMNGLDFCALSFNHFVIQ